MSLATDPDALSNALPTNAHPQRTPPSHCFPLGIHEQALVLLKIKETVDAEAGQTKAVTIEGG